MKEGVESSSVCSLKIRRRSCDVRKISNLFYSVVMIEKIFNFTFSFSTNDLLNLKEIAKGKFSSAKVCSFMFEQTSLKSLWFWRHFRAENHFQLFCFNIAKSEKIFQKQEKKNRPFGGYFAAL